MGEGREVLSESGPDPDGVAAARREHFTREGWVLVRDLIDARTIASLVAACDFVTRQAAGFVADTTVRGVEYQVQSASGRTGEPAVHPGALRKVVFASKGHAAFVHLRTDPRVLSVLRGLGLPAPYCLVDQLNLKLPQVGTGFPFHQDAPFLIPKTRAMLEAHGGANVLVALDATDAGNGALEVLGRSHHGGARPFAYDTSSRNEGVFDETHRTLLEQAPGDAVIFHPLLAHGSGPNPSSRPRRMVALWFVGA